MPGLRKISSLLPIYTLEAGIELWYLKTIIRRVSVVFLPLVYQHCFHQLGALFVLLPHLIAIMGVNIGIRMYCKYFL